MSSNSAVRLLTDAASFGHTVLPQDVVLRTASRDDVDAALADLALVDVEWQGRPAWALSDVAESEELLADGLAQLAAENRLAVVASDFVDDRVPSGWTPIDTRATVTLSRTDDPVLEGL